MKKTSILLAITLLATLIMVSAVHADSEPAYCFDTYKFGEGLEFNDIHAEKFNYKTEETVRVSYNLKNIMESPIVDGRIRVQIFYNHPDQSEQMIDEYFIEKKDIALMPGDLVYQEFTWQIPKHAKTGEYIIKTYFIVGAMFNLQGLSIIPYGPPGVPGAMTTFNVQNTGEESTIYFDKTQTSINAEKDIFGTFVQTYDPGTPITVATVLKNAGPAKKIHIIQNIYEWDDLTNTPMKEHTKEHSITLQPGSEHPLTYTIPNLPPNTYEIKFTATVGDEKTILKLRTSISGPKTRFIYMGIDKFPLIKGEETTIFFCMSNAADHYTSVLGSGTLEILDKNKNTIHKEDYESINISAFPTGRTIKFTPSGTHTYLTLKQTIYDEKGTHHDTQSLVYDLSKFKNIESDLTISTPKETYAQGETLAYTVSYRDKTYSTPLTGTIMLYIEAPDGNIMHTVSEQKIDGTYQNQIKLYGALGTYTISARETFHNIKAKKTITLTAAQTQKDQPPIDQPDDTTKPMLAIALLVLAIGGIIMHKKQRAKKK